MIGKSATHFQTGSTTLVSKATEITGDLHFSGNLEIEGVVRGNIIANDKSAAVRVMHKGRVEGKIQSPKIVINGEVEGDVYSTQHLELAAKAHREKKQFIESLLALGETGPLALLTMKTDGQPYIRMHRASYLIGMVGLNEMVKACTGEELNESKRALKFGLKVISHMNLECQR